ncbi:MAG: hypothetical protein ACRDMJ_16685 [Solirubrobacteraceae bacterium]
MAATWEHGAPMEICLVHLVWVDAGEGALRGFLKSYAEWDAGAPHRLLIIWSGFQDGDRLATMKESAAGVPHDDLELGGRELDLTAYRLAAETASEESVCFVNSYSTILHDGWLALLAAQLTPTGVGLVGATGSHESPLSGPRLPLRRLARSGRYPPFPNPHLRTNAFMLRRDLFLSLRWPRAVTKESAWELESGVESLTRQVGARGLETLVVGRDGVGYPSGRWRESATFRAGDQRNLLVADNRTRQYEQAGSRMRRRLERLAWGGAEPAVGSGRRPRAQPE